ncbi:DUF4105 domain-containing protein [Leptospira semungkisensis]|uniref:DUF4105 domain-containing protein n=1 Tax=Leptospira semungkisensis TaxID=2484985 RepID=A0A4V3JAS9_9LEPT|nr:DUF4105 domain-containing protein [Leptospira semungkisensis]TGJ99688.1 DUF4105 domain-containing protein [Leptospira semungkisensis]
MPLKSKYLVFLSVFFFHIYSVSAIEPETLSKYKQIAESKKLWEDRYWTLLIHYTKTTFGWESEADSPSFFLSEKGRKNPKEELLATLSAIVSPASSPNPEDKNWMHPRCKFPERTRWLQQELGIPNSDLAVADCSRFEKWIGTLNPKAAKIIFASYYMNAPASIFGHTLLKIDSANEDRKDILEYAVNYAANADPNSTNAIVYAVGGLFGGYPGVFSLFPYYIKIGEYNDAESRDLWEYELGLEQDEVIRMTRHIWELGSASFDYYFLDENCSYHLLSLLEVARPSLHLRNKAPFVIPGDTVKKYIEQANLVKEIHYRPSIHSKILQKVRSMNEEERNLYLKVIRNGDVSPLFSEQENKNIRISLLTDSLMDSFQFRKMERDPYPNQNENYKKLLLFRSKINTDYDDSKNDPITQSPHVSHGSSALYNEVGTSNLGNFYGFGYRAAIHDLLNTDTGYVPNSSVDYFSFKARYYENTKKLHLEDFHFVRLLSLTPYNSLSKSVSYFVDSGADSSVYEKDKDRQRNALRYEAYVNPVYGSYSLAQFERDSGKDRFERVTNANLEGTAGYSFQDEFSPGPKRFLFSVQAGFKGRYNGKYDTNAVVAPQGAAYFIANFDSFKAVLSLHYYAFGIYNVQNDYKAQLGLRYAIHPNHELRIEAKAQRNYNEASFSYVYQF